MEHKRTGWEYLDRMWQLDFRALQVKTKFIVIRQFYPIKAMFLRKRFNKTLKLIHEMKLIEAQKGYWA